MGKIWDWLDRVFIREHQGHGHGDHRHDHDHNRYKAFLKSRSKPETDQTTQEQAAKEQSKPADSTTEEKTSSK